MEISVPSKTFLIGEYGALVGGPALLVNTEPRFVLHVNKKNENQKNHFTPAAESPAGQLFQHNKSFFNQFDLTFVDPHFGKGGLGASSAQFAVLYALLKMHNLSDNTKYDFSQPETLKSLLQSYRELSRSNRGLPPSGYDVVAQILGDVSLIDLSKNTFKILSWSLNDLSFFLIRTGSKLATHTHLSELVEKNFKGLAKISESAVQNYLSQNAKGFLESVKNYRNELRVQGLVSQKTESLLSKLEENTLIEAAKGCGALGADMIAVFCLRENKIKLKEKLQNEFEVVADEAQIVSGICFENEVSQSLKELSFEV